MSIYDLDSVIDFGKKHRGRTVEDVLSDDPGYLLWALESVDRFETDKAVHDEIIRAAGRR